MAVPIKQRVVVELNRNWTRLAGASKGTGDTPLISVQFASAIAAKAAAGFNLESWSYANTGDVDQRTEVIIAVFVAT